MSLALSVARGEVSDSGSVGEVSNGSVPSTFEHHRHHLDLHAEALGLGLSDAEVVAVIRELDAAVADDPAGDGHGFRSGPLVELELPDGGVLTKVETDGVGGSHKARHLFGLLLRQVLRERAGSPLDTGRWAIASCGNAAVGAATVASAFGRDLDVYVPVDASAAVLTRLEQLGAHVTFSHRAAGEVGDPCMRDLEVALDDGAVAFTVQGTVRPDTIDGCRTLGLEIAEQLLASGDHVDDVFIQIGGGALATAVMDGLGRGLGSGAQLPRLSRLSRLPRLHPVQPRSAHPYAAAVNRLTVGGADPDPLGDDVAWAMEPWPGTPASVASGILDDVTYDWRTVYAHQRATGGWPVLVDEEVFVEATDLARTALAERSDAGLPSGPAPDATGAAGLAGWLTERRTPASPDGAAIGRSLVLLTGADRAV